MRKHAKQLVTVITSILMLVMSISPAFADTFNPLSSDVYIFGYQQDGHRSYFYSGGKSLDPAYYFNSGLSFSQPLLISPDEMEVPNDPDGFPAVIVQGSQEVGPHSYINMLYGFNPITINPATYTGNPEQLQSPTWEVPFSDGPINSVTKSHPTLSKIGNYYMVFTGTLGKDSSGVAIDAFDVTNSFTQGTTPTTVFKLDIPEDEASDIVSAPEVINYDGHPIVVFTTGETGLICFVWGFDNYNGQTITLNSNDYGYLYVGGRTSSTVAPILNGTGLLVGVDNNGIGKYPDGVEGPGVYLYNLSNVIETSGDQITGINTHAPFHYATYASSGQGSSFAVDNENNIVYCESDSGDVYAFNINPDYTLSEYWPSSIPTDPNSGDLDIRSVAFDGNYVYAVAGTTTYEKGQITVITSDGSNHWSQEIEVNGSPTNADTAPGVWDTPNGQCVIVGTGAGVVKQYLVSNIQNGNNEDYDINDLPIVSTSGYGVWYGIGISGEIAIGYNAVAVTGDKGVEVWYNEPYDFAVKSVTLYDKATGNQLPTDNNGNYIAQPGEKCTAKVVVYLKSGTPPVDNVTISGIHVTGATWDSSANIPSGGTWNEAGLDDPSGNPIPTLTVYSINNMNQYKDYVMNFSSPASDFTYWFNWTADQSANDTEIGGAIDYPSPTMTSAGNNDGVGTQAMDYADVDMSNNILFKHVIINHPVTDISLSITATPSVVTGVPSFVIVTATRANSGPSEKADVHLEVTSTDGTTQNYGDVYLGPGDSASQEELFGPYKIGGVCYIYTAHGTLETSDIQLDKPINEPTAQTCVQAQIAPQSPPSECNSSGICAYIRS